MSSKDPNNPLVGFLAAYGPTPSSNNLYDEFVVSAGEKSGCEPLEIEQPLVAELVANFEGDAPRSAILTGTAGDGKTYTARKVLSALNPSGPGWGGTDKEYTVGLKGRSLRFIKDLSELKEAEKDTLFDDIAAALTGREGADLFVICVNDGHLLKFFRDRESRSPDAERLHRRLREMLRTDAQDDPGGNFRVVNMSRQPHDELIDQIIDGIAGHPRWAGCQGCSASEARERLCPILFNLTLLADRGNGSMRARIKDMIRMAAADGRHLSIRQLILLMVNILLGDGKQGSTLLTCTKARRRARENEYALTNPYAHAFGENLGERQRAQYGAFTVIEEFGIGRETNNRLDQGLMFKDHPLPEENFYGEHIFEDIRRRYNENPTGAAPELRHALVNQRRRLFFSIDPAQVADRRENPWNLSIFKHGDLYIRLVDAIEGDEKAPKEITDTLLRGLNRMMTGVMTTTSDKLWLTKPSGVYLGREVPLLVEKLDRRTIRSGVPHLRFDPPSDRGRPPRLAVVAPEVASEPALLLRPILFECLCRIAEGALPASFTEECLQDIERFQLAATAALTRGEHAFYDEVDSHDGELQSRPIKVMEET